MTINLSDNDPRISYTVASGVTQGTFTVPFEFFTDADLNLYVDGTLKTLSTDYTTTGGSGGTGTIVMNVGSEVTGASGGSTVVITRSIALERTTDFQTSGPFAITALNTELDKLIAIQADLKDSQDRSLQLTDYDADASLTLPDVNTRKGKLLAFNATTGAVEAGASIAGTNTVASLSADIETLADIEDGTVATNAVSGLAAISSDVTAAAAITSNITSVAGIASSVSAVAADATDIGTVATNIASVNTVATNIADVVTVANDLNEAISEIETAADDLNLVSSNIETVATNIANVNAVGAIDSDVTTVAGIASNVTAVAGNATNINAVGAISANVSTVAGIASGVTAVAADATDIGTVAADLAGSDTIGTVAGSIANVNTTAGSIANVNSVASNATNINSVASVSSNVTTVAGSISNVNTVAGSIANVNSVAGSIANVNTVASNLTDINNFNDQYTISASAPLSPAAGDLWYDSSSNVLKYYTGSIFSSISAGISDVVSDTTPQLGGNLDLNSSDVTGTGNINITGTVTATSYNGDGSSLTGISTDLVGDTTPQLGGNLDTNGNAILFGSSAWSIELDTGDNDLLFKYNGTTVFKLASSGAVTSADDITAFGTP